MKKTKAERIKDKLDAINDEAKKLGFPMAATINDPANKADYFVGSSPSKIELVWLVGKLMARIVEEDDK